MMEEPDKVGRMVQPLAYRRDLAAAHFEQQLHSHRDHLHDWAAQRPVIGFLGSSPPPQDLKTSVDGKIETFVSVFLLTPVNLIHTDTPIQTHTHTPCMHRHRYEGRNGDHWKEKDLWERGIRE